MKTTQKIGNIEITRSTAMWGGADGSEIRTVATVQITHSTHVEVVVGNRLAEIAAQYPMTADEAAAHAAEREELRKLLAR